MRDQSEQETSSDVTRQSDTTTVLLIRLNEQTEQQAKEQVARAQTTADTDTIESLIKVSRFALHCEFSGLDLATVRIFHPFCDHK